MARILKFPSLHRFANGKSFVLDMLKKDQLEAVYAMFLDYAKQGSSGIGRDEIGDINHMNTILFGQSKACTLSEEESGQPVALITTSPSPLARSSNPLFHAGYMMVDTSSSKRGIGMGLLTLFSQLGQHWGYKGILGRCSMNNSEYNLLMRQIRKANTFFTGTIPSSIHMKGKTYMDDLIIFSNYGDVEKEVEEACSSGPHGNHIIPYTFQTSDSWECIFEPKEYGVKGTGAVCISPAGMSDFSQLSKLFEDAAKKGDGFAVDEIIYGSGFNRKAFAKSQTLVAKDNLGEIIAGAVVGPSSFCRSRNPPLMHFYVVVGDRAQGRNVGQAVVDCCMNFAKEQGFSGVLSDVFLSNRKGLQFALSTGLTLGLYGPIHGLFIMKIPYVLHIPKVMSLVVDHMKPSQVEETWAIFSTFARHGLGGIGVDEIVNQDHMEKHLFHDSKSYAVKEEGKEEIVSFISVLPSPIARSTYPFLHGGYIVIDRSYQKKGIGRELYFLLTQLGKSLGYEGLLGRSSIRNSAHNLAVRQISKGSLIYTGGVPDSTRLADLGYVDDLVYLHDYGHLKVKVSGSISPISGAPCMDQSMACLPMAWETAIPKQEFHLSAVGSLSVAVASEQEQEIVEDLFMRAGLNGDGFGLDEFLPGGIYNRKHFKSCLTLLAKVKDKGVGAAVIGPSGFCKSSNPKFMTFSTIVEECHQNRGIGKTLGEMCTSIAQNKGFGGVLCDSLLSNNRGLQLAHKLGMWPTAIIPYSCFVKNVGYTDAILFVKTF